MINYHRHAIAIAVAALLAGNQNAIATENEPSDISAYQAHLSLDLPILSTEECIKILGNDKVSQCLKLYSTAHDMARTQPPHYSSKQQCEAQHQTSACSMNSASKWVPSLRGVQITLEGMMAVSTLADAQQQVGPDASSRDLAAKILEVSPTALIATKSQPLYGDMAPSSPRIELLPVYDMDATPSDMRATSSSDDAVSTTDRRYNSANEAEVPPTTKASPSSNSLHSVVAPALTGAAAAMALQHVGQAAPSSTAATRPNNDRYRYPSGTASQASSRSTSATANVPTSTRQNSTLGNTLRQNSDSIAPQQHAASSALSRGNLGSTAAARQGWGSDNRTATVPSPSASKGVDADSASSRERRAANDAKKAPTTPSFDASNNAAARSGWGGSKTSASSSASNQKPQTSPSSSSSSSASARQGWGARSSSSSSSSSSSLRPSSSSSSRSSLFGNPFSKKKR